jgi:hypothetical protein
MTYARKRQILNILQEARTSIGLAEEDIKEDKPGIAQATIHTSSAQLAAALEQL